MAAGGAEKYEKPMGKFVFLQTQMGYLSLQNSKGLKDQGLSKLFNRFLKVQFPDNEGDDKRFDKVTVKGVLRGHGHIMSTSINSSVGMITSNKAGHGHIMSTSINSSVGMITLNKASHSSQNMLDLLDKVDKLEEHHSWMHFSSTECNQLSEAADAENSDGSSCHLQQCQSPTSQGYGLKLAPPSQQLPVSNHISPSPSQTVDSFASTQATFIKGDKGLIKLASNSPGQSFHPSYEISQAELQNNRTVIDGQTASETSLDKNLDNFSSPANFGFSFPSSQFQNQPVVVIKEPESVSRLIDVPYNKHVPKQANDYYRTFIGDSAAASPPNAGSVLYDGVGISEEGALPNIVKSTWIDVPKQQPLLGAQAQPDQVKVSQFQDTVMVESTSTRWNTERQELNMRNSLSELDAGYMHLQGLVCGEKQQGLSGNTDLVQKINESQRRGPIIQDLSDAFPSNPALTKTDIEAFGCSLKPNNFFEHNDSTMNQMRIMKNLEPVLEHSVELRPKTSNPNNRLPEQVASKLEQLGNESNDMVEDVLMHTLTVQSDTADTGVIGNNLQCSISSTQSIEHLSAPESLPTDNVGQKFTFSRPKKRKTAASELQSFHNEALQGYLNPQTISMAETNWAKATKRPCEKVGDSAHTIEDGPPMPRARKRLILTTQLMQQLFHAPPAQILSADASLNYETVDYIAARLALADTCNLVSRLKSYSDAVPVGANFQADKCKTSDGVCNQHLSRVMEDFMSRARKVENEILRPEKRSSVLNLRLEGQDIEKIYVVNRIANIYVRGQAQVAETSSSNAALNAQKPFQEKHVAAVPFPSNLPDKVPCLSL